MHHSQPNVVNKPQLRTMLSDSSGQLFEKLVLPIDMIDVAEVRVALKMFKYKYRVFVKCTWVQFMVFLAAVLNWNFGFQT